MLLVLFKQKTTADYFMSAIPLLVLIYFAIVSYRLVKGGNAIFVFGKWHYVIDNCSHSAEQLYSRILDIISSKSFKFSTQQVSLHEGAAFVSPKRNYLRISRDSVHFDICGMPYGNGYIVSWRCYEQAGIGELLLTSIPFLGILFAWYFKKRPTYYRTDQAIAFQTYVHNCVKQAVDEISDTSSNRATFLREQTAQFTALT